MEKTKYYKIVLIYDTLESSIGEYSSMFELLMDIENKCKDLLLLPLELEYGSIGIETMTGTCLYHIDLEEIEKRILNNEKIIK